MWDILNNQLEAIYGTKGVPVFWYDCDAVFYKDHRDYPEIYYICIYEELVAICPMIIASYSRLLDEATADDIHARDQSAMYRTDKNIVFSEISHIFSRRAFWVHSKCAVKTRNGRIAQ